MVNGCDLCTVLDFPQMQESRQGDIFIRMGVYFEHIGQPEIPFTGSSQAVLTGIETKVD